MKLLSLLQNQPLPGLLVLSHWKHIQHVRIKNPQKQWQLSRPAGYVKAALLQRAVTPACIWARCANRDGMWKCECTVCRVSRVTPGWEIFLHKGTTCPWQALLPPPAHTRAAGCCGAPACSWWRKRLSSQGERKRKAKLMQRNTQRTNPHAIYFSLVQLLILQGSASCR